MKTVRGFLSVFNVPTALASALARAGWWEQEVIPWHSWDTSSPNLEDVTVWHCSTSLCHARNLRIELIFLKRWLICIKNGMSNLIFFAFGLFSSFSQRWARNPLNFVSFGSLSHLLEPISWFSLEVLWLSVTNPVILPWYSYWCWAVLSIQSLPLSCMGKKNKGKNQV